MDSESSPDEQLKSGLSISRSPRNGPGSHCPHDGAAEDYIGLESSPGKCAFFPGRALNGEPP